MLRRRPDLSWPLIALLAGLFVLSLRMPRQWERIARDSRLALPSRTAPADVPPTASSAKASEPIEPAVYQTIEPATAVAANVEAATSNEAKPASVLVFPAAALSTTAQNDSPTSIAPVKDADVALAAERSIPTPQSEPIEPASATRTVSDEVHVLRDASASPISQPVPSDEHVTSGNPSFGRSLVPEPEKSASQTQIQPSESATIDGPTLAANAVPESSATAAKQFPTAAAAPTPSRPVAPEPRSIAADSVPQPSTEPMVSQSSPVPTQQDSAPEPRASIAAPAQPPSETSSLEAPSRPMKAIGRAWEEPADLLARLEQLKKHESASAWATETMN